MTRSLVWKDTREQASLALAVVFLGLMVAAAVLTEAIPARLQQALFSALPYSSLANARNIALAFAWAGGLVAGGLALAGEREGGTLAFLDALTRRRWPIWRAKCQFAAGLTLVQIVALLVGMTTLELRIPGLAGSDTRWSHIPFFVAASLYSFAWGMLGSAWTGSALAACGVAIVGQIVGGFLIAAFTAALPTDGVGEVVGAIMMIAVTAAALVGSAAHFCRSDRMRAAAPLSSIEAKRAPTKPPTWRVMAWLSWRQSVPLVLLAATPVLVVAGSLPSHGFPLWPIFTGVLGLAFGITVFAPEHATVRFLGDRRLPAGTIWRWKLANAAGVVAAMALFILVVGLAVAAIFDPGQHATRQEIAARISTYSTILTGGFQDVHSLGAMATITMLGSVMTYLAIWPIYGFAVGQFVALLLRKAIIAGAVGLVVLAVALGLWLPSMAGGGLHACQWLSPPLILLAATRLAMRPWLGGRLAGWRAGAELAAAVILAIVWQAGALWYRAAEIHGPAQPFDVPAYLASLPTYEQNAAGRGLVAAAAHFDQVMQRLRQDEQDGSAGPAEGPAEMPAGASDPSQPRNLDRAMEVPSRGWPADDRKLGEWLDRAFASKIGECSWADEVRAAVAQPPGFLYDPRQITLETLIPAVSDSGLIVRLLCARALQLEARGDAAGGLDQIALAQQVARHLRTNSFPIQFMVATGLESIVCDALEHWVAALDTKSDLLPRALKMMQTYEMEAAPVADAFKAEYFAVLNTLSNPARAVKFESYNNPQHADLDRLRALVAARETAAVAPWEVMRTSRLLSTAFAGYLRAAETPYPKLVEQMAIEIAEVRVGTEPSRLLAAWIAPSADLESAAARMQFGEQLGLTWWASPLLRGLSNLLGANLQSRCDLRAAQIQMALAIYERREGKPAPSLDLLVPAILPAIPLDPFNGEPFHYRVSTGETVRIEPAPHDSEDRRTVAAGQGVIWSVGPDLIDQGGKAHVPLGNVLVGWPRAGDFIYLVPTTRK